MKKVLFITYYWPPAGGAPINRILKFYSYLPDFGWEPVILTTRGGDFPFEDQSLLEEVRPETPVYRSKGLSLHKIFSRISPKSKKNFVPYGFTDNSRNGFMDNLSRWVKYNFIPDTRFPWYFKTVGKAVEIIRDQKIDLIFSSSPPQTNHLIARAAAKRTGIPWVGDFRDPWTDVFWLLDNSKRWKWIHRIDQRIERRTIAGMNAIITVGPSLAEILGRKTDKKIAQITNGFDDRYFSELKYERGHKFRIIYAGSLSREQDPACFFDALELLKDETDFMKDCEILFLGNFPVYLHELAGKSAFSRNVIYEPYTIYTESLRSVVSSELLLLIVPRTEHNKCILTSKLFDYMGARRPVLAYGPVDGDAAAVLNTAEAGKMFAYHNSVGSAEYIRTIYRAWKSGTASIPANSGIERYTRRNLTRELAEIFDSQLRVFAGMRFRD